MLKVTHNQNDLFFCEFKTQCDRMIHICSDKITRAEATQDIISAVHFIGQSQR